MINRDKEILIDLERFRVMSRNDIADIYFSHLKNPITNCNTVLKRLVRDKQIQVSKEFRPYVYFPYQSTIKKNSTKIPHFLSIVQIYKQIKQYNSPSFFQVEPKYKKGLAEPDILTTIKGVPFFIEVQRNHYSQKVMNDKIKRYEALYYSEEIKGKFPFIMMVSDTKYEIENDTVTIFQVTSVHEFMANALKKRKQETKQEGIKFKIG